MSNYSIRVGDVFFTLLALSSVVIFGLIPATGWNGVLIAFFIVVFFWFAEGGISPALKLLNLLLMIVLVLAGVTGVIGIIGSQKVEFIGMLCVCVVPLFFKFVILKKKGDIGAAVMNFLNRVIAKSSPQ